MKDKETARLEAMERDRHKYKAYWKDTGKEIQDFMEEYSLCHLDDEDITVFQSTGIRDKNNTLIYQGNKVRYYAATKIIIFYKGSLVAAQEDYKPGDKIDYMGLQTLYDSHWEVEVLGNIYESKDDKHD